MRMSMCIELCVEDEEHRSSVLGFLRKCLWLGGFNENENRSSRA